ncbi:HIT family protein [Streptomyces filamentosus]|uniref:HIT family protein n=1 Tax=Streptomyces filamentosus TaxID=67294 RepID=UPI0033E6D4BF
MNRRSRRCGNGPGPLSPDDQAAVDAFLAALAARRSPGQGTAGEHAKHAAPHETGEGDTHDRQGVLMKTCVFCAIAAGEAPAVIVREWPDALAIRPRSGGVNASHLLVLPRVHVDAAGTDPEVTAAVMRRAAELMAEHPAANLITSKGAAATQTVFHLHVHVLSRQEDDGLPLPWTPQHTARAAAQNGVTSP